MEFTPGQHSGPGLSAVASPSSDERWCWVFCPSKREENYCFEVRFFLPHWEAQYIIYIFLLMFSFERVSLCNPAWPWPHDHLSPASVYWEHVGSCTIPSQYLLLSPCPLFVTDLPSNCWTSTHPQLMWHELGFHPAPPGCGNEFFFSHPAFGTHTHIYTKINRRKRSKFF